MRYGYADPPYLGLCKMYDHDHGAGSRPFDGLCWDEVDTHRLLIEWLSDEFPDGWALSLHEPSLRTILPLCPDDCRTTPWVKPFASFKPGVNPAYTWEPVIWRGGRKRIRQEPTVKDHIVAGITLKRGFIGAKPPAFTRGVLGLLGVRHDDEFVDVFPGSGSASEAWNQWRRQATLW